MVRINSLQISLVLNLISHICALCASVTRNWEMYLKITLTFELIDSFFFESTVWFDKVRRKKWQKQNFCVPLADRSVSSVAPSAALTNICLILSLTHTHLLELVQLRIEISSCWFTEEKKKTISASAVCDVNIYTCFDCRWCLDNTHCRSSSSALN